MEQAPRWLSSAAQVREFHLEGENPIPWCVSRTVDDIQYLIKIKEKRNAPVYKWVLRVLISPFFMNGLSLSKELPIYFLSQFTLFAGPSNHYYVNTHIPSLCYVARDTTLLFNSICQSKLVFPPNAAVILRNASSGVQCK